MHLLPKRSRLCWGFCDDGRWFSRAVYSYEYNFPFRNFDAAVWDFAAAGAYAHGYRHGRSAYARGAGVKAEQVTDVNGFVEFDLIERDSDVLMVGLAHGLDVSCLVNE